MKALNPNPIICCKDSKIQVTAPEYIIHAFTQIGESRNSQSLSPGELGRFKNSAT